MSTTVTVTAAAQNVPVPPFGTISNVPSIINDNHVNGDPAGWSSRDSYDRAAWDYYLDLTEQAHAYLSIMSGLSPQTFPTRDTFFVKRAFLIFDTGAAIPEGKVVIAATLKLNTLLPIGIVSGQQSTTTNVKPIYFVVATCGDTVALSDWNSFTIGDLVVSGTAPGPPNPPTLFSLNIPPEFVVLGAKTKFAMLCTEDYNGTTPTQAITSLMNFGGGAALDVTYDDPPPPEPPEPPPVPGQGPINRTIYCDWTGAAPTDQNRNWCPEWSTPASSMCLSRRSDGSLAILFGTNDGSGRILRLDASTHNDDGAAIDAMYQTAYVGGSSGRNTFQYLTSSVAGDGPLDMGAVYPDGILVKPLKTRELQQFPTKDQEWSGLRILTERIAWRFGTNAVDAWFKLRKLCGYARPSPWSRTLGPPSN